MNFVGYLRANKRWHPKVARAAEQQIKEILADANIDSLGDFWADFEPSTNGPPCLIERFNSKDIHRVIKFSAGDWLTVESSVSDAVNQLASVLAVYARDSSLTIALELAGLAIGRATTARERFDDDPNEHASIVITSELSIDQFFSLVDRVETELHLSGTGDVSGTGCGIGGWCIDLSAASIEECVPVAVEVLNARELQFDITRY
jgi:hypothetical protein